MPTNPDTPLASEFLEPLDDREGPALRQSTAQRDAAVRAAVDRALPVRRQVFERRRLSVLLVAAALAIPGIGLALILGHPWSAASAPTPTPTTTGGASLVPSAPREAPRSPPLEPLPEPPGEVDSPDEPAAPTTPEAGASAPTRGAQPANAQDSLLLANQLRREGRWADAAKAYSRIARVYPGTAQGSVASLAAASLHLEHLNDPRGALGLYQAARKSAGLSAEAELGIANSYRALGDRAGEIAALRRLVSAHPEGLLQQRAQRRLDALLAAKP